MERTNNRSDRGSEANRRRAGPLNTTFETWDGTAPPSTTVTAPSPGLERNKTEGPRTTRPSERTNKNYLSPQSLAAPSAAATARRSVYGPVATQKGETKHRDALPLASVCTRLSKETFKPGTIFRALVHEESLDRASGSSINPTDRSVTESRFGPISSKWRKMVVIGAYQDHYVSVPMYTHNGRGLSRKAKPEEYVSVRDHRQAGPFTALSKHRPLVTKLIESWVGFYDPVSTLHFTYSVSRGYILPVAYEGFLEPDSTKMLVDLVREYTVPQIVNPDPRPLQDSSKPSPTGVYW